MITKPSDHLDSDSRFKHWGKLVTAQDLDLTQTNGYSLNGEWVQWNESVALESGRYLVVASELGSRKYCQYSYRLIDSAGNRIPLDGTITPALDAALAEGRITETQRAKALKSTLYAFALYIHITVQS